MSKCSTRGERSGQDFYYRTIAAPTAIPAKVTRAMFTCNASAPAMKLSPGPNCPLLPPGLGARPPGLPPPSTLGLAVGRMLGVVLLLVWLPLVEFVFEEFPLFVGEGAAGVITWVMEISCVCVWPFTATKFVLTNVVVNGVVAL